MVNKKPEEKFSVLGIDLLHYVKAVRLNNTMKRVKMKTLVKAMNII